MEESAPMATTPAAPAEKTADVTKMKIKRVGILSVAKATAIIYGLIGLVFGLLLAFFVTLAVLFNLASSSGNFSGLLGLFFAIGAIITLPIFYGLFGFIGGLIGATVYNLASGMIGGIEIEVE
jgi:uncharacterized protein YacL